MRYLYHSFSVDYSELIEKPKKAVKVMREWTSKAMDCGDSISIKREHLYSKPLLEAIKHGSVVLK